MDAAGQVLASRDGLGYWPNYTVSRVYGGVKKIVGSDVISGVLDIVSAGAASYKLLASCFGAGTLLATPTGPKAIEDFRVGDLLWSRHEDDRQGPVEAKTVEEVFVRVAQLLHLHVPGQVIKTTAEHPFYVKGKGWTPAWALRIGDELATDGEQWVPVEDLLQTEEYETVYNLRVADWHTYFVSCVNCGFCIWAHNAAYGSNNPKTASAAKTGQGAHRQIEAELRAKGINTEVPMTLSTGQNVRKDGALGNDVYIIKPDTTTGRASAKRRSDLMFGEGFNPNVILYDPTNPAYQPGSPTYIGPK
jgi:hypothetical protein